jgi:Kef-type K+ transport system membrane component KefB
VFFVASGLAFDLGALTAGPGALAMVAVFLAALLLVRGLPALAYRTSLTGREVVAAGLLQATSLPFLVAGTAIGSALGALDPEDAAALVGAGLLSVVLFPALALRLAADTGADPDSASGVTLPAVEPR